MTRPGCAQATHRPWHRTAAFTVLFVAAVVVGRLTRMEGSDLAVVWPAAGVAVLWLSTSWRHGRRMVVDLVLLEVATAVTYVLTGASVPLALGLGAVNVLQPVVACLVLERLAGRGPWQLRSTRHLAALAIAAIGAATVGAVVGPAANWLATDVWTPAGVGQWLLRNSVCIFLPVAAGIGLLDRPRGRVGTRGRTVELAALAVTSVAAYLAVFGVTGVYPLSFIVLPLSLWAGLRFSTRVAAAHSLLVGGLAVGLTIHGFGPFSAQPTPIRAAIAQAFIGVVGYVTLMLAVQRAERDALMAELRVAAEQTETQATLLSSILDSISDGVSAVDAHGRFLLRNPASRRLMGVGEGTGPAVPPSRWQEQYGLFHPDGTPIPPEDMPMMRALRGDPVTGMDMLIRNPTHPHGRLVSISTRPLDGVSGRHGAVAVYHDVTDDRRRQSELASFAGVVAHDLLNPLATITSWTGIVEETVARMPADAAAPALDGLRRIERASTRMQALIRDLLAYSSAKDSSLHPADLPLTTLAHEVVGARLDGRVTGTQAHRVRVGALPDVHADAVQVRQLLDNLVGNALKYTIPGQGADIVISAVPGDEPGWAQIEVADRGIGVPAGQHEVIFGDFERAHPGGAYTGTGLGLAICRRIVSRHGGRIAASDNPGGGTRVTFSLPLAAGAARETGVPSTADRSWADGLAGLEEARVGSGA